jgi:Right handed beta helix region
VALCFIPGIASAATLTVDPANHSTTSRSFNTISEAAEVAMPGDTVVVHAGVYREDVKLHRSGTPGAPIRFVADPPGSVVVTGADVISKWQKVEGAEPIYRVAWPHVFAIDYQDGKPVEFHPDSAPLYGRAEQMIADEKLLLPCKDLNDLRAAWKDRQNRLIPPVKNLGGPFAGMFAVDTTWHVLYLWLADGSDPNQHAMQASTRQEIFGIDQYESKEGVHDIEASGFIFRYAASFPQRAAVILHGHDNDLHNCIIEKMAGTGVGVSGKISRCLIQDNGHTGGAVEGDNFLAEQCVWRGNCWKPIDRGWESGGAKVTDSQHGKFDDCLFYRNGGPGLWFDVDCRDVDVRDSAFMENELSGLFIEICQDIRAENNYAAGNATDVVGKVGDDAWSSGGIQIAESQHCVIRKNICVDNRDGITLRETGPRPVKIRDEEVSYHILDDRIEQNTIMNNREYGLAIWWDNAFFAGGASQAIYDPLGQKLVVDRNSYDGKSQFLYGVPWRAKSKKLASLSDFTRLTGFEKEGKTMATSSQPPYTIEDRMKQFAPFGKRGD